jgi:putative chitinase
MTADAVRFELTLRKLWPHAAPAILDGIVATAPALFDRFKIDALVCANMMGEFTEESAGGTELVENLNYRAAQLMAQWPRHFTQHQALEAQHNPRLVADQAYNGRMGNRNASDDGWNYRGRGLSQTTGRDAYREMGDKMGLDLLNNPDLINDPKNVLLAGCIDFVEVCGCLTFAERDDEINETRHLNGGLIGYPQRQASIRLWKHGMGV